MDRVLFGDNQFFGINHMSEEKAKWQAMRFRDTSAIISVLDAANDAGIHSFMCTTHERVQEICDHVRANRTRYSHFKFLPCMPYAHKYANAVTEHGPVEALRMLLPEQGKIGAALRGGLSLARKDVASVARMLIDAEMKMFVGLETPVIFLQNVVTDLLLGMGFHEAFSIFADHVRTEFGAEPGFITMNLVGLLNALDGIGLKNPIVCANINKVGFRMSGGIIAYEEALRTRQFRPVAMSVLASGAISPEEAISYVCSQPKIESIVFGASTATNIRHTMSIIEASGWRQ